MEKWRIISEVEKRIVAGRKKEFNKRLRLKLDWLLTSPIRGLEAQMMGARRFF